MTDSLLVRSWAYTTTSLVPFPPGVALLGADGLLSGETDGFAIDATTEAAISLYVGGPNGGTVSVKDTGTPANNLSNVSLDSSNLVQSGTSPKMVHFNAAPYVRWSPHNYCLQSQTFGTTWSGINGTTVSADATTAPDGTSTADKIISANSTNAFEIIIDNVNTVVAGQVYTVSVYAKPSNWNWIEVVFGQDGFPTYATTSFNVSTGAVGTARTSGWSVVSAGATSVGSGWYRCSLTVLVSDGGLTEIQIGISSADNFSGSVVGDGSSGAYLWGAQINRGPIATPYLVTTSAARIGIPQAYDAAASKYGILVEPAATNIARSSENFASTWSVYQLSATADQTTAPDGSSTADAVNETATTTDTPLIYDPGIAFDSDVVGTLSVYAKKGTRNYISLELLYTTNNWITAVFDLNLGVVGETAQGSSSGTVISSNIVSIGNGWYRCSLTGSVTGGPFPLIGLATAATGNSINGDGQIVTAITSTNAVVYLWGAQLETGSVATSYIPTLGSSVVRAVDAVTVATSTYPHSATSDTHYLDYKPGGTANVGKYIRLELDDGGFNEEVYMFSPYQGDEKAYLRVIDGGAQQSEFQFPLTRDVRTQITFAWALNDIDATVDAQALQSDGTATMPTVTTLRFGTNSSAGPSLAPFYIYRFVQVPAQVQTRGNNLASWRYNF